MPDPAATGGEELGLRIKMMRGKRAQKAVAEVAGITQGYLSEVETGKKIPSLPVLARIANAIGTTDAALRLGGGSGEVFGGWVGCEDHSSGPGGEAGEEPRGSGGAVPAALAAVDGMLTRRQVPMECEYMLGDGKLKIRVIEGDITTYDVEAVTSASNNHLWMGPMNVR